MLATLLLVSVAERLCAD